MAKKIPVQEKQLAESYIKWDNSPGSFAKAAQKYGDGLNKVEPFYQKTSAALANRYEHIDRNTSVRDSFSPNDYAFFRPGEMNPRHFRDIIAACLGSYQKIPQVRQVIDLMSDFTAQGIRIIHPDPEIQNFYDEWSNRINMEERSERSMNCLYKAGNVIIKRADALLDPAVISDWKKTVAKHELDLDHEDDDELQKNAVPYRYTILNPLIVEVLGEHIAAFTGQVHYVLKLPSTFYNTLSLPLTSYDPSLLTAEMPRDLQQAMDRNEKYLILDSEKLITLFYKKDDWDVWAYPMLYSLLDEFVMLQKLKQTDLAAMDGIISHIRVWKLGSLEHNIFPADAAIQKLASILLNHVGGGDMDFIWGPDIELQETSMDTGKILSPEKYEFVMNTINQGLGIPAAIGESKGDMSSNFMSLRILMERLVYGRKILTRFWLEEIKRVQQTMGFKTMPYIQYDNMVLHDETAEKALWIQLLDRDIIPASAVQERFGRIPEIDNLLIKKEYAERNKGNVATKVSPYHDSQPKLALTKIGLQRGAIAPDQLPPNLNLNLKDMTPDETDKHLTMTNPQVMLSPPPSPAGGKGKKPTSKNKTATTKKKPVGISGSGRPQGKKDSTKRTRTPNPTAKGEIAESPIEVVLRANRWQRTISELINPAFLADIGKSNLRKLSAEESVRLERLKFDILFSIPLSQKTVSKEVVQDIVNKPDIEPKDNIAELYKDLADKVRAQKGEDLTFDELRDLRSYIYASLGDDSND